jgi:hypothetical protein
METWHIIKDFQNYSVSNYGNIMNIKTNKVMKLSVKGGYYSVGLVNNSHKKTFKVHRLVANAFIENTENKPEVNHKDKNKLNNNVNNLEWNTRLENNKHRCEGLLIKNNKNKQILRIDKYNNLILEQYNSIEDAGIWAFNNNLTSNSHNGRNSIGNCLNELSNSAYGYKWKYVEINNYENEKWKEMNLKQIFDEDCEINKKYFVSNLGRFKNSSGKIMCNYKVNDNGYIRIYIYKKTFLLHRLIALTFIENPENKEQVNHIDGNKINNCVNNLEWCTNKENQIHKFQNGLGNNYTRKIGQYDLNGNFIKEFNSITLAAKEVNVSKSTIRGVLINYRKTSAGFIWKYLE